ncbi:hypothetical protein CFC21_100855 [Triticum aestivum]|uniref:F-box domain-containing protein n=2 Tax=Triticum aestivum TaxID=4565 RepID=A0A9R1M1T6_WHEAT|nr:uncharacterized protein LOC123149904 [Triticum aestivum]XP_044425630.1 uncharacterized protein LOC123149905 [Triticum aestivum]XP_044445048.1 uncharacterized protein LOC123172074 [Triticum aestivum]KAF7099182.1 hypothetical protein CFC21_100854 [Triticum aestivum]KAF7099183.1 hypothetical protein CFC21_100855 [Triticum aestivum]
MASPAPPCGPDASPAMESQASLPDHLTEDILLRLPTAADLARASMAGPSLRRIVTDHSFLRRFRVLHPPPLLGILSDPFIPAQPPHPSAAAAGTLAGTDFSCSFLPSRERPWIRRDFRDGRALFCVAPDGDDRALVREVAVCDPLHRRYLLLPPVPQDLSDLVYHCQPFLAPAGGDEVPADAPLRFRVMCLAKYQTQLVLFVLSSSGGCARPWHAIPFDGWSALVAQVSEGEDVRSSTAFGNRYYAHGCFCWAIPGIGKLLMLDIATMEFSSIDLLPSPWSNSQMAFVEAREGRLGLFALSHNRLLYSISGSIEDDPPRLSLMGAVVPLPLDYVYYIIGVAGGFLLLHGFQDNPESYPSFEMPDPDCFSLNLQTMKLERFCGTELMMPLKNQLLYAGFPPSLSPPTI